VLYDRFDLFSDVPGVICITRLCELLALTRDRSAVEAAVA
jgi:hypothetical protein